MQKLSHHTIIKQPPDSFTSSTSNGSTTTSTSTSTNSSVALDCSSSEVSSPLKLPSADRRLIISSPLKLQTSTNSKHSTPSPGYSSRRIDAPNGSVKRSMALMKLRRQGSHPPALISRSRISTSKSCNGSFQNQAAVARELMASLERALSLRDQEMIKTMEEEGDVKKEARKSLLREERYCAPGAIGKKSTVIKVRELPLTAKIAAAMDSDGHIGVQEEIECLQFNNYHCGAAGDPASTFKAQKSWRCAARTSYSSDTSTRSAAAPASSATFSISKVVQADEHARAAGPPMRMMPSSKKRRGKGIILRRLRSSRALLGKIWRNIKRVLTTSSKKHLHKELMPNT